MRLRIELRELRKLIREGSLYDLLGEIDPEPIIDFLLGVRQAYQSGEPWDFYNPELENRKASMSGERYAKVDLWPGYGSSFAFIYDENGHREKVVEFSLGPDDMYDIHWAKDDEILDVAERAPNTCDRPRIRTRQGPRGCHVVTR